MYMTVMFGALTFGSALWGQVATLTSLSASIQTINAATTEHVGFENAVTLPKLANAGCTRLPITNSSTAAP